MTDRKQERRGLGRGLSALMADVAPQDTGPEPGEAPARPEKTVPVEQVVPNPDQPRRSFDRDALDDLANSIREKGIIQPLIVRASPRDAGLFEIVAGERRWRAAQIAQLHQIPIIVRELNDTEVLEIAIIENIQRADLNPVEEAAGYRQLMDRFGHTQEKLAEALGKSRSHIANQVRLLTLPEQVLDLLRDGELSAGHARALVVAEDPAQLAREIVKKGLSVRQAEVLAKKPPAQKPGPKTRRARKDADTKILEQDLSAALRMRVSIDYVPGRKDGTLSVKYSSLAQLDDLCRRLSADVGPAGD